MYDKVEIVAGVVAGLVVDEVCYAGAVRGGGEFGGVGWKTGKPILEFYFEFVGVHRGGCFEVVIECRVMLSFFLFVCCNNGKQQRQPYPFPSPKPKHYKSTLSSICSFYSLTRY